MAKMTSATNYPFATCPSGHSLDGEDAFIVQANGSRACRMCIRQQQASKKQKTMIRGSFDGTR